MALTDLFGKIEIPKISYLAFSKIPHDDFYCVRALDGDEKIFLEGRVCGGIIGMLRIKAKADKAEIVKVRKPFLTVDPI